MKLYHFTSLYHLPLIKAAGQLNLTESNIGSPYKDWLPYGEHFGPDVVWLTERILPSDNGLGGSAVNKQAVRIEVDIDNAVRWVDFANRHGINRRWYRYLDKAGGFTSRYWWVALDPIVVKENQITLL
jgi:hypothetical protein